MAEREHGSNNPPDVLVELTSEQALFLEKNCNANISYALGALQNAVDSPDVQPLSEPAMRKLVDMMEHFKGIREQVRRGLRA